MRERRQRGFSFDPTSERNPSESKFNYRPLTLKLYGLLSLLITTLALIGILEFANRTLPKSSNQPQYKPPSLHVRNVDNRIAKRIILSTGGGNMSTIRVTSTPASETTTLSSAVTLNTTSAGTTASLLTGGAVHTLTPDHQTNISEVPEIQTTTPESSKTVWTSFDTPPVSTLDPEPANSTTIGETSSTMLDVPSNSTSESEPTFTSDEALSTPTGSETPTSTDLESQTDLFVPTAITQTLSPSSACTTDRSVAPTCTCPSDGEIPSCTCIPSSSVQFCACTILPNATCPCLPSSGVDRNDCMCRQCVCPPDNQCQKCLCASGSGSFYAPCECPADPQAEECTMDIRESNCDVENPGDECQCDSITEWSCGIEVASAGCSVEPFLNTTAEAPPMNTSSANSTAPFSNTTAVSVLVNASSALNPTALIPNTTVISVLANTSSALDSTTLFPNATVVSVLANNSTTLSPASSYPNTAVISVLVNTSSSISPSPVHKPLPASPSSPPLPPSSPPLPPPAPTVVTLVTLPPTAPPVILTVISIPPSTGFETPVPVTLIVTGLSPVVDPTVVATPEIRISSVAPPPLVASLISVTTPSSEAPLPSVASLSIVASPSPPAPSLSVVLLPSAASPSSGVSFSSIASLSSVALPSLAVPSSSATSSLSAAPFSPLVPLSSAHSLSLVALPSSQATLSSGSPLALAIPTPLTQSPPPSGSVLILATDSQGQPITIPATLPTPNLPSAVPSNQPSPISPVPGGIFLVSSSLSTDSLGQTHNVPVTFLAQTPSSSVSVVTGPKGDLYTIPTALLATENPTDMPTAVASAPSDSGGEGSSGAGGGSGNDKPSSDPVTVSTWPMTKTFLGGYMPIIVARLYHMGWTALHTQINDLSPFSQLASHGGAPASALFGPGLSTWYSWLGFGSVWVMSPIAAESIFFDTNYGCPNPNPKSPNNPCWPPRMSVNTGAIRTLQVLLSIVAVVIAATAVMWHRKPSGCSGDPTSIAAIAAIMGHPDVEWDFRHLDTEISTKELKKQLKGKKYKLGYYWTAAGIERHGIIPTPENDTQEVMPREIDSGSSTFGCGSILGATTAYVKAVNSSSLAKVFGGKSFGRRLLFALLGCLTSSNWMRLGRESQTLSPYMRLNQPNAHPTSTILLRRRTLPITAFFPMLLNQHFAAASTALASILSEFLLVTLSGLPYRPGQLREEFILCGITSITILVIMIIVLISVNAWRRFLPHLPRKPDSVAAVMTYVCESRMNADFEGLEHGSVSQRDRGIVQLGKSYRYGLRRRVDGMARWVIDETGETQKDLGVRKASDESFTSSHMS